MGGVGMADRSGIDDEYAAAVHIDKTNAAKIEFMPKI
jgi:hypothetical protein